MSTTTTLAVLLETFFTRRLMQERQASPHTISSYRDTFRQFLKFTAQRLRKPPSQLDFEEIDAPLISAFLDDLEKHHGVSTRSRCRAAIKVEERVNQDERGSGDGSRFVEYRIGG